MSDPTALKQYIIDTAGFGPGDISVGSVDDANYGGGLRIHYQKVGKLYFGFWAEQLSNNQCTVIIGGTNNTEFNNSVARIAALLGFTVDTAYKNSNVTMYGQSTPITYTPGTPIWTSQGLQTTIHRIMGIIST